jgi:small subunit ribosomal protein S13
MTEQKVSDNFRHIVRINNTDLKGDKKIGHQLTKIKGIGFMMANFVSEAAKIDRDKKAGDLSDEEIKRIDEVIKDPLKYNIPDWMINRRKEVETGEKKHLTTSDLTFNVENDIRRMRKVKSYKGMRHSIGQPVRGQKTRSNFRKNKGKVMGVKRAKSAPGAK